MFVVGGGSGLSITGVTMQNGFDPASEGGAIRVVQNGDYIGHLKATHGVPLKKI
jgi:hypothetical protein